MKAVFHKIYLAHSWILCPIFALAVKKKKKLVKNKKNIFKTTQTNKNSTWPKICNLILFVFAQWPMFRKKSRFGWQEEVIWLAALLKKTLQQMFSCGFCESFKKTFFIKHLQWLLLPRSLFSLFLIKPITISKTNQLQLQRPIK